MITTYFPQQSSLGAHSSVSFLWWIFSTLLWSMKSSFDVPIKVTFSQRQWTFKFLLAHVSNFLLPLTVIYTSNSQLYFNHFSIYARVCACMLSGVLLFATPWTIAARLLCSWDFPGKILEWVAISSSRGSSWPRGQTHISCVSCIGRQILSHWTTWEAPLQYVLISNHALKFHSIICQLYLKKARGGKVLYLLTGWAS